MPNFSLRSSLALLLALPACGGKGTDTTANNQTDSTTSGDATFGGSTTSGNDSTATQSTAEPTSDTPPVTTTGPDPTTIASDGTSTSTTTGEPVCVPDPVMPGRCDGGKPKSVTPRITSPTALGGSPRGPDVIVDDLDPVFASTTIDFIQEPDAGDIAECDIFGDDCGPGEKCNAWASNGGSSWNATKCVPVAQNPDPIGAPCTAEGGGVSGIDSCVKGAMCWDLGDDNMGTCVEQCTCSVENPICTTGNTSCTITNNGVLALCLPGCDPLDLDTCPPGDVCIGNSGTGLFQCVLDASGDQGGADDSCEFANACDPGFLCASNNGNCAGAGCCAAFCDVDAPVCPGGIDCVPFFEEGQAPKCFEDVGICFAL